MYLPELAEVPLQAVVVAVQVRLEEVDDGRAQHGLHREAGQTDLHQATLHKHLE